MALFELVSGDFEREHARVRYSEAGRAYLRLTSNDGLIEDVFLETDVAGVAESGEGRIDEYLVRWAARDGFDLGGLRHATQPTDGGRRPDGRGERHFVVLLRDGRKFVARGTPETVAEFKASALPAGRHARPAGLDAARAAASRGATPGDVPRFVPGLLARLLASR